MPIKPEFHLSFSCPYGLCYTSFLVRRAGIIAPVRFCCAEKFGLHAAHSGFGRSPKRTNSRLFTQNREAKEIAYVHQC